MVCYLVRKKRGGYALINESGWLLVDCEHKRDVELMFTSGIQVVDLTETDPLEHSGFVSVLVAESLEGRPWLAEFVQGRVPAELGAD